MGGEGVLEGTGTAGKHRDKNIGAFYGCAWVSPSQVQGLFLILRSEVTPSN